jgi:hypothetical protein
LGQRDWAPKRIRVPKNHKNQPQPANIAGVPAAAFDGAFVANQSHRRVTIATLLERLPAALVAARRKLRLAGCS